MDEVIKIGSKEWWAIGNRLARLNHDKKRAGQRPVDLDGAEKQYEQAIAMLRARKLPTNGLLERYE